MVDPYDFEAQMAEYNLVRYERWLEAKDAFQPFDSFSGDRNCRYRALTVDLSANATGQQALERALRKLTAVSAVIYKNTHKGSLT